MALCLAFVVTVGCKRENPIHAPVRTSEELTVFSGVGIPGVCSVTMNLKQIQKANPDSYFRKHGGSRLLVLPSLGAVASFDEENFVNHISFETVPVTNEWFSYEITKPFAGKLNFSLSFNQRKVTRDEIEAMFGTLPVAANSDERSYFHSRHLPHCSTGVNDSATLIYPRRGIILNLDRNGVRSFSVSKPKEQGWRAEKF